MRTEIDITEGQHSFVADTGRLPEQTVIRDDGDIVLSFGDVAIRMTYDQFATLLLRMTEWTEAVPPTAEALLSDE